MKADPMKVYYLAKKWASYYVGKGIDYEDLLSIAMLGAVKACARFNPEKGALTTIATTYMRSELNASCYRAAIINGVSVRKQRFIEESVDNYNLSILTKTQDKDRPDIIFEMIEFNRKVSSLSHRLPEKNRAAFMEFYKTERFDNYIEKYNSSHSQASKVMSESRVKMTKWLKESLEV